MWLEAVDLVLSRLADIGTPFEAIRGISGAGQQHGSIYWTAEGEKILANMNSERTIVEQLSPQGFASEFSPNWQDASTQRECDQFDAELGGQEKLAQLTGSKAHHVSLPFVPGAMAQEIRIHMRMPQAKCYRLYICVKFLLALVQPP